MAASGSESVEFAPNIFPVSFSQETIREQISVAIEKCQLCSGSRRNYYCLKCLRSGDFVSSDKKPTKEIISTDITAEDKRYKNKRDQWLSLIKDRESFSKRASIASEKRFSVDKKKSEILFARQRNECLKLSVKETQEKLKKEKEILQHLKEENEKRKNKSSRHREKMKRILESTEKTQKKTFDIQMSLNIITEDLVEIRRRHTADLVSHIYPITLEKNKNGGGAGVMEESTVGLLAEARQTSYVKGRWVYTDNGGEQQFKIVHPAIPGNGDYTAYSAWLTSNRHILENHLQLVNPTFTVGAALQYTAQLVCVLACLLDVNLPYRVGYGDMGGELEEERFNALVFKLNSNVLQLCFSQAVPYDSLQASHTLHNILTLLRCPNLGRSDPFSLAPELMASFEESHQALDVEDEDTSEADDVIDGDIDWEQVPASLHGHDIPHSFYSSTLPRQSSEGNLGSSTNLASGFMSSMAAIGSSWWKNPWSGRSDRK